MLLMHGAKTACECQIVGMVMTRFTYLSTHPRCLHPRKTCVDAGTIPTFPAFFSTVHQLGPPSFAEFHNCLPVTLPRHLDHWLLEFR